MMNKPNSKVDKQNTYSNNPLISSDYHDTLFNVCAMIRCLQQIKFDGDPDDETEYGVYLVLETIRMALFHEARKKPSK